MTTVNHQFTVQLPAGWVDNSAYLFSSPDHGGRRHTIHLSIDRTPRTTDVDLYAQERIEMIRSAFPQAEVLKAETTVLANRVRAFELIYTLNQQSLRRQIFVMVHGQGYTFTGDFTPQELNTVGTYVRTLAESLSVPGSV